MSDDEGYRVTRRRSLAMLGSGGAGLLIAGAGGGVASAFADNSEGDDYVANAKSACTLTAEQEVGPYYVAYNKVREDIVGGVAGLPMTLTITVISSLTCKPLKNAAVDVWQCDPLGVYSDESAENTLGKTYLRGVQFTDKHGQVTFKTLYPGHYAGRTAHIHAKVHIGSTDKSNVLSGGHVSHIGQMFPPDAVNAEVFKLSPYTQDKVAVVTHAKDRVWTQQHGSEAQIVIKKVGSKLSKGVTGTITLAVNPNVVPAAAGTGSTGTGTTTTAATQTGTTPSGTVPTGTRPTGTPPTKPTGTVPTTTATTAG